MDRPPEQQQQREDLAAATPAAPRGCLDDNAVLALIERLVEPDERLAIEAHLDDCPRCRQLVSAVAAALPGEASDAPFELEPDEEIDGRFRVMAPGDLGPLGQRYRVLDRTLACRAWLTLLDERREREAVAAEDALARLTELRQRAPEIQRGAALPYAAGRYQGLLYVVERERRRRALPVPAARPAALQTALWWLTPVAQALAALHAAGATHGAVASSPLLIDRDGEARLGGFVDAALATRTAEATDDVRQLLQLLAQLVGTSSHALPSELSAAGSAQQLASAMQALRASRFDGPSRSPYPGDAPLDVEHADVFAGREAELAAMRERLATLGTVGIFGPAKSGKSSLLRAGLAAATLRSASARPLFMRPGARPYRALVELLARARNEEPVDETAGDDEAAARALLTSARGAQWLARHLEPASDGAVVLLVIDQLEDLVDAAQLRSADARRYIALVAGSCRRASALLAVAGRDLPEIAGPLAQLPERSLLRLEHADRDALERALRRPLELSGYSIDDQLVQRLCDGAARAPAPLSLLSRTMRRLWSARDRAAHAIVHREG